MHITDTDFKLI